MEEVYKVKYPIDTTRLRIGWGNGEGKKMY